MHVLLSLGLLAQLGAALPPDSVESLRDRARDAESRYERLSRRLAPLSWSGGGGSECDEIVGRFCLRFDSTSVPPETADGAATRIVSARREAVEAMRRWFSAAPSERRAAGPLVRLLVRDGRAAEAIPAAGAFAALSRDTVWGNLLLGFAHHAAGSDADAERHFITALQHMAADERSRWRDPSWLLDPAERSRVRRMSPESRSDYERRYWLLADPFWLTSSNERWNEHIARHIEARLLEDVPPVAGMLRWGDDMDELTVRYGTPTARARQAAAGLSDGLVEFWDTAQRVYAPGALTRGVAPQPAPGERPLFYAATARAAYALRTGERVLELMHQVTRFVRGDSVVLRVDAALPFDARAPGDAQRDTASFRTGLFVYDSAFTQRRSVSGMATTAGDTTGFTLAVAVSPGTVIYSAEVLGDSITPSGRARYALDAHLPAGGPILSDLLIGRPFAPTVLPDSMTDTGLRPFASLVFAPGDTLGIYAEAYRLAAGRAVDVQVALEPAGEPSLLGRFARWIGRGLGVVEPVENPRVSWRGEAADSRYPVALNVPLPADRDGLHDIVLRITDPATGDRTESRRRILIR